MIATNLAKVRLLNDFLLVRILLKLVKNSLSLLFRTDVHFGDESSGTLIVATLNAELDAFFLDENAETQNHNQIDQDGEGVDEPPKVITLVG